MRPKSLFDSPAFTFVILIGLVNLFGDITYEGGASINGPFMGKLGASAAIISITAGLGEFLGYSLRSVFGYIADKTGKYWVTSFIGYAINLLAVPAMALAPSWKTAALLILAERTGRAIRKPTIEAMLSYSTSKQGKGWVYGVSTAMDETGATIGPLFIALILFLKADYRTGYAYLLISAFLAMAFLAVARVVFPVPSILEQGGTKTAQYKGFTASYWLYMIGGTFLAAGLMSFELISYHLSSSRIVTAHWIPIFLALSTGMGVVASLVMGKLYDRIGIWVVIVGIILTAVFPPLVLLGGFWIALFGLLFWGIGYAIQDTLLKALIASALPEGKRNFAFGLFYLGYGGGWIVGSTITGLLYNYSRIGVIVFTVSVLLTSIPFFLCGAYVQHPLRKKFMKISSQ